MFDIKAFFKLLWPVLIEQILATTIGMVNTMMVSGVGTYAISAVSIVDSVNFVIMNLFIAFSTGATVIVAQRIGARDYKRANESASHSMSACVFAALVSGLAFIFLGNQIINFLFGEAEELVKSNALIYLVFSGISYPFLAIFSMSAGILRASGDTKAPMRASILSNTVNAGIGALCIYVLKLGVTGAGIALLSARVVSAVILFTILLRPGTGVGIKKITVKLKRDILWPVMRIGLPASIDGLIFNGGKLLIQTLVTSLGTVSLATNGVSASVISLINIPGNAIALVAVTIIGQSVGAGIYGKALKKNIFSLVICAMVLLIVMILLIFPLLPFILELYSPPPDVKSYALSILQLVLFFMPFTWPTAFILPACLRSTGDSLYVTIISVLSMWLIRVLGGWISVKHLGLGLTGIWFFWCMDWVARSIIFFFRGRTSRYVNKPQRLNDTPVT